MNDTWKNAKPCSDFVSCDLLGLSYREYLIMQAIDEIEDGGKKAEVLERRGISEEEYDSLLARLDHL